MAEVGKVTSAKDRSSIRVYMKSARLIHKQNIYDLEHWNLKTSCFQINRSLIKIQENTDCQDSIRLKSF